MNSQSPVEPKLLMTPQMKCVHLSERTAINLGGNKFAIGWCSLCLMKCTICLSEGDHVKLLVKDRIAIRICESHMTRCFECKVATMNSENIIYKDIAMVDLDGNKTMYKICIPCFDKDYGQQNVEQVNDVIDRMQALSIFIPRPKSPIAEAAPKDDAPKDDAPKDDVPKDDAPKDDDWESVENQRAEGQSDKV